MKPGRVTYQEGPAQELDARALVQMIEEEILSLTELSHELSTSDLQAVANATARRIASWVAEVRKPPRRPEEQLPLAGL